MQINLKRKLLHFIKQMHSKIFIQNVINYINFKVQKFMSFELALSLGPLTTGILDVNHP